MGHTPFGYRIENGVAVIDEDAAGKLRMLYDNYLGAMSLMNAAYSNKKDIRAKVAGMVTTYHPADNTEQGSEESNRVLVDEEKDLE